MKGALIELWRFPVKSMKGERLQESTITKQGVLGDRAYGVLDVETGKVGTAKSVRQFPNLMACRATFVEPPALGYPMPAVRIDLPNGISTTSDANDVDTVLSGYFQREVRLVCAASDVCTYDQYDAGVDAAYEKDSAVETGFFVDSYPVSVLTTSTLDQFNELQPGSRFDSRRFRMNVIVKTKQPGFVEDDWVGQGFRVGAGTRLDVIAHDSRCVMTTLPQDDLPHDPEILRAIARHNRIPVDDAAKRPCAGVYAKVVEPGLVRTGDLVDAV